MSEAIQKCDICRKPVRDWNDKGVLRVSTFCQPDNPLSSLGGGGGGVEGRVRLELDYVCCRCAFAVSEAVAKTIKSIKGLRR